MVIVWITVTTALVPTNLVNVVDHHQDNAVYHLAHHLVAHLVAQVALVAMVSAKLNF